MRSWVLLVDRAERHPVYREALHAIRDGAYWGWLVALVAAVAVWAARGAPSPVTAAAAAALMPLGAALAAGRTWRRTDRAAATADRRAAATTSARRWLTGYGLAAALIPAGYLITHSPLVGLITAAVAVAALVELAIVTIPVRARARLLARLRIGARAVAGTDEVQVGRALWRGMALQRALITYPADWGVHRDTRRDDLVERIMWELCGPPPRTPAEAARRPDYLATFDHVNCRLIIERVPTLPRLLPARALDRPAGAIVLGQTHTDTADAVLEYPRTGGGAAELPVALYRPRAHALIVGGTQHGKSSGVRAWVVDGLTHGVFPGGVWCIDGKGSGSMAGLLDRQGVHAVAHTPDEWRQVLVELVAPEVRTRYAEILDWRAGRRATKPDHPRALLNLDEIQQVLLACPDLAPVLDTLARQALEAGVILWVITQRPDARDAVPGAMRDQLLDRVSFGPLSGSGAKMAFDVAGDWHRALGIAPIAGRALVWLDGHWRLLQAPWLPLPADDPTVEPLYPPRAAQRPPRPTPRPQPTDPAPESAEVPGPGPATWPPPPPRGTDQADDAPAYDPGAARRRRRRTT